MKKKIGIVENCEIDKGIIKTENDDYLFLNNDLFEDVQDGDVVSFYEDERPKVKRAFFVKKLTYNGFKN